tara:strand:- start:35 stop:274 length:240 start_codon:yes stop_codon:yes gene_type:complete
MKPQMLSLAIAAAGLTGAVYAWAANVQDVSAANQLGLASVEKRESIHRGEHTEFRTEYRQDIRNLDQKIDRLLLELSKK